MNIIGTKTPIINQRYDNNKKMNKIVVHANQIKTRNPSILKSPFYSPAQSPSISSKEEFKPDLMGGGITCNSLEN